jgi:pimeloyl-ACP methyl ester carboxylesterase
LCAQLGQPTVGLANRGAPSGGKTVAMAQPLRSDSREPREPGTREIRSRELMAERDGLKLKLYEKFRVGNEESWKQNGKVILLVHGATWASRCTFDPDPEHGYSMMEMLADAGYDVFALDLHGYGKSERSDADWTDSVSASRDIEAAVEFIRALRWVERLHVLGYQWGAQPAAMYTISKPNKVARLALFGLRWRQVDKGAQPPAGPLRTLGQQASLLKPEDGDLDPEFVRRRAQVCRAESQVAPNGALRDLSRQSTIDPNKIKVPTLIIQGERDGSPDQFHDRVDFFHELGTAAKWYAYLPGLGKYAPIERTHARFDQALVSFLDQQ